MDDRPADPSSKNLYVGGRDRKVTLIAIIVVFLLSALDQTVVATAMPRIVAELHGLSLYSWVTTAYMLASTVMVPIWGKLGDEFGRKRVLLVSILIFIAGSWLAGLAGEVATLPLLGSGITQLIAFRALQGIGGGGLVTTGFGIIGDLYAPRERARITGAFGSLFGLCSALGPMIGGFLTDHCTVHLAGYTIEGWRWVFYVNLPLSLLSICIIVLKLPSRPGNNRGQIDFLGSGLIVATVVPFLIALTQAGGGAGLSSARVALLLTGTAVGALVFVVTETRAANPVVPLALFRNAVFSNANLSAFLISMSFMSTLTFLPLFMQAAQGRDATSSGLSVVPCMVGLVTGSLLSGQLATRSGRYKSYIVAGLVLALTGILLLSQISTESTRFDLAARMFVLGLGLGPCQGLFNIAIQNAVPREQMGVATSCSQFFRQIGATVGVALCGTLVNNGISRELGRVMPGATLNTLLSAGPAGHLLPEAVRHVLGAAIARAFAFDLVTAGLALFFALKMPGLELHGMVREPREPSPEAR